MKQNGAMMHTGVSCVKRSWIQPEVLVRIKALLWALLWFFLLIPPFFLALSRA
jgi:hypothetical protein